MRDAMHEPIDERQTDDGEYVVLIGNEQGQCTNGMRACAMYDTYPRTEHWHCGCKGEQSRYELEESTQMLMGLDRTLEGMHSVDDIAPNVDESPEEFEEWLQTKPE